MTAEQKIEALTELLHNIIFTLEMKSYDIDHPTLSHKCEIEADEFHEQMCKILYNNEN